MAIENKTFGEEGIVSGDEKKSGRLWKWVIGLVVILAAAYAVLNYFGFLPTMLQTGSKTDYQAVFLSNGQVYFGKLSGEARGYAVLKDIYYLQVTQLQPIQAGQNQSSNINLVKLGGELHGPTDEMRINRDHILFVENLASNSRVVAAIKQLQGK